MKSQLLIFLCLLALRLAPAGAAVRYVNLANPRPAPPYTNWASAATNIQDAVGAASAGDEVVVTNGVYATGGRPLNGFLLTNRVTITKPVTVRSVNGPEVTVILGHQTPIAIRGDEAVRCAYLEDGAMLTGFTLTNGATRDRRFGLFQESSELNGAGAFGGTLNNCTLSGNSAYFGGGGAFGANLNACVLIGNSAETGSGEGSGGGAFAGTLNKCVITGNFAENGGGGTFESTLYNCTLPLPPRGTHNFTSAPIFFNAANGNLRLQSNSPCISSGLNALAPLSTDLDGNPRIVGATVDVGAYEFQSQSPQSRISYAWLQQYGLPTDGSADDLDPDGDRFTNFQESQAGTDPTDARSFLSVVSLERNQDAWVLVWRSVAGRSYTIEAVSELGEPASFVPIVGGFLSESGLSGANVLLASDPGTYFFRVRVEE